MPCGRHCDNPRVSWDDRDGGDGGQTDPLFQRDPLLDGSWAQADLDGPAEPPLTPCLLYTSDAADERSSVDLGGRRII